jgi:ABC-type multidrug transport system ATPase subunit
VAGSTPDALWSSRAVGLMQPMAVRCTGLRKTAGRTRLLDGIDLEIPVGTRLLLVGHPDEAAAVLLRILAGLARAERGSIEIAGERSPTGGARGWARRIAYLGPRTDLYPWLSAREALDLTGRLIGLEAAERRLRIERAVSRFRLATDLDVPMKRAGPSLIQRTALAAALLGDPEVVLLDEPLRGVEPEERARLLQLPGRRTTLLLVSRYPASEAGIVNRVALLRGGRLALDVPVTALADRRLPLSQHGIDLLGDQLAATAATGRASA